MKVMYDVNVLLDALLEREPFAETAARLLGAAEQGRIHGFLCSDSVTTIYYFAAKNTGSSTAKQMLQRLLQIFDLAPVDRLVLQTALGSSMSDFEDAVLCESAYQAGVDAIVTRNLTDFRYSPVKIYSAEALLSWLIRQGSDS